MAEAGNKTADVSIERDGDLCRVRPGETEVGVGDEIRFQNLTDKAVTILFSEEKLFQQGKIKITSGKNMEMAVQQMELGRYPYAVYCECINDFALASSMPIIIIVRK